MLWHQDGLKGPEDPNNSERFLVESLMVEGNLQKYRGGKNGGLNKLQVAQQAASFINGKGQIETMV